MHRFVRSLMSFCAAVGMGLASPPCEAQPTTAERVLVDFARPAEFRLAASHARGTLVAAGGSARLEVVTEAGAPYPSVRIEPADGVRDLRTFDAVAVDVQNTDDAPLRVLLNANNPGADGRQGCSTASLTLGPKESGTLIVRFGVWHGESRPFDPARIASFEVLLDRPSQAHRFLLGDLRAMPSERFELERAAADPFFRTLRAPFGRGINLGNALEAPSEGEWGVTLDEAYFRAIAEAGFDSIRLPVRWSAHAAPEPPYAIEPKFLARVDWAVEQALSRGLEVVLNMHHYSEMDERPDEHRPRLVALWRQVAEHYRNRPATLAFELLNEPHDRLTAGKWNEVLSETLAAVRESNPTRTIVIGPVGWNAAGELPSLRLPESDRRLVVTVHYYAPFAFTHQGAPWLDPPSRPPTGVRWTGSDDEQAAVRRDLDAAALWGLKHRRPVYLGEFGALNTADLESRARWTKFVAAEASRRKMGFAYWEFCSGFGAYDAQRGRWIEPLREAVLAR